MRNIGKWEIAIVENGIAMGVENFWFLPAAQGGWLFQLEGGRFLFFERSKVSKDGYYLEAAFEEGHIIPDYLARHYVLSGKLKEAHDEK